MIYTPDILHELMVQAIIGSDYFILVLLALVICSLFYLLYLLFGLYVLIDYEYVGGIEINAVMMPNITTKPAHDKTVDKIK